MKINEDIHTRNMLNVIREAEGDKMVDVNEDDLRSENDTLSKINNSINITSFKLYPEENNAIMTGEITNLDSDFVFQMDISNINGLFITTNSLKVNDEAIKLIAQLKGYYETWSAEWSDKVKNEY